MSNTITIFKRELASYFTTPVAYVFICIFLFVAGWFTFSDGLGGLLRRGQADLIPFFGFLPWFYLFLIPAITMRIWSEERKTGSIELLMTLPVTMGQAVWGKFLAAWAFTAIALLLTFPMWITVNYLGTPDNGVIVGSYIGAILMAGAYLSIGCTVSAITKNQVIAFAVSLLLCLIFVLAGLPAVLSFVADWAPQAWVNAIASFSFLANFEDITRGILDLRNVLYFLTLIAAMLFANAVLIDLKKAE